MANDIITNYSIEHLDKFKQQVTKAAEQAPTSSFRPILKFTKQGEWVLGKERDEVTMGTRLVIFGPSMQEGWIGWQNGKVVGEKMHPVGEVNVENIQLEEIAKIQNSDGWYRQVSLEMKFLAGADNLQVLWKASTAGAKEAFYDVVRSIAAQFMVSQDFINPVIELDNSSYQHKSYGTIYKPQLNVVDWMSFSSPDLFSKTAKYELPQGEIDVDNLL